MEVATKVEPELSPEMTSIAKRPQTALSSAPRYHRARCGFKPRRWGLGCKEGGLIAAGPRPRMAVLPRYRDVFMPVRKAALPPETVHLSSRDNIQINVWGGPQRSTL